MKIAQVCPYDYTYPGGVVAHISHLKSELSRAGHEVKIIAPCSRGRVTFLNEPVINVGRPYPIPSGGSMARVALSPKSVVKVADALGSEDFDIVHIHEPFTPTVAVAATLKSRGVTVGTFHACHTKPRGYWIARGLLKRYLVPRLDGKIAVSKPALEFVSRHLPGEYHVIPNGIDINGFSTGVAPLPEFKDGKFNILFVGRLEKRKGFDCLLRAYGTVKRRFPHVRLMIVGPGSRLRAKYERMVEGEALEDVVFMGYVPQEDLPRCYATADVFCAPATGGESFGIVLLEAMASGKPIVATRIPGYSSVITDNVDGIMVAPRDPLGLAEALTWLIRDPELGERIGAAGRRTAEAYSWERVTRRVVDFYGRLLAAKRQP